TTKGPPRRVEPSGGVADLNGADRHAHCTGPHPRVAHARSWQAPTTGRRGRPEHDPRGFPDAAADHHARRGARRAPGTPHHIHRGRRVAARPPLCHRPREGAGTTTPAGQATGGRAGDTRTELPGRAGRLTDPVPAGRLLRVLAWGDAGKAGVRVPNDTATYASRLADSVEEQQIETAAIVLKRTRPMDEDDDDTTVSELRSAPRRL